MQHFVMYATDMYYYLPKISSERYIFNFGYLSSKPLFIWARMWRSVVICRGQKGPESRRVWETL